MWHKQWPVKFDGRRWHGQCQFGSAPVPDGTTYKLACIASRSSLPDKIKEIPSDVLSSPIVSVNRPIPHDGPGLEFASWHGSEGRLPIHYPHDLSTPSWISIKNTHIAPGKTAENVTVSLGFVNSERTQLLIVPEAVWYAEQSLAGRTSVEWSHEVKIEGGDDQSFVLFAQDQNGRVIPYKNGGEPFHPLEHDKWDVKIAVSSDNVRGFEGIITFTQTRNSLAPGHPAFAKLRFLKPRLETIEQFLR
jgi:hypothetical protein